MKQISGGNRDKRTGEMEGKQPSMKNHWLAKLTTSVTTVALVAATLIGMGGSASALSDTIVHVKQATISAHASDCYQARD
jgi:hypothetical protein